MAIKIAVVPTIMIILYVKLLTKLQIITGVKRSTAIRAAWSTRIICLIRSSIIFADLSLLGFFVVLK